jgi:hypothetical protein
MKDYTLGETIDFKFTTCEPDTGAPATLSGTPVISAYVDNSTTQITAGITLTVDFDGVTGLNNVRVVATSGNGYTTGTNVALIITTGTVDTVSAVGYKVAEFSLGRAGTANVTQWLGTAAATPTTAGVPEVDVTHWLGTAAATPTTAGVPEVDVTHVGGSSIGTLTGAYPALGIQESGTMQAGSTGTTAVLRAATSFADDTAIGSTIWIYGGTGTGQKRLITDWVSATDTATVDAWVTTPDNTSTYIVFPSAPSSGGSSPTAAEIADAVWDESTTGHTTSGTFGEQLKTDVDAILVDTAEIGAAGAGLTEAGGTGDQLTAIPWNASWDAEVQSECTDALNAYDPPTNAEMEARTIAAASYATAANQAAIEADTQNIQSRLPAALNNGVMPADIQRINDIEITGDGQVGTEFGVA